MIVVIRLRPKGPRGRVRSGPACSELVTNSSKSGRANNNWHPAVRVEQRRRKGNKLEYRVLFDTEGIVMRCEQL